MKKYEGRLEVSRRRFETSEIEEKPRKLPKPVPADPHPFVFDRLFNDIYRRKEAKNRLAEIMQLKDKERKEKSMQRNFFKDSLSPKRVDVNKTVERLHLYWEQKWSKIEEKKREITENQEKTYAELTAKITRQTSDPEIFKRLTTVRSPKVEEVKTARKTFSIREAIESGKRLMGTKWLLSQTPKKENRIKRGKDQGNRGKSKESKQYGDKTIDEIMEKCKIKALGQHPSTTRNKFKISVTENLFLAPSIFN
jgi:hypothetical protein